MEGWSVRSAASCTVVCMLLACGTVVTPLEVSPPVSSPIAGTVSAAPSTISPTFTEPSLTETLEPTASPEPSATPSGPVVLTGSHAHNDYQHDRPLYDALDHSFTSVEVDIFLVDGDLLVAHDLENVKPDRTLRSLYLDPLRARVRENGGWVYPDGRQLTLLIDIKSEAESTYLVLREILQEYSDILTRFESGVRRDGAVVAIISGNRPKRIMERETIRYAAYDGRLEDLNSGALATFIPLISDNWTVHFTWTGEGPMPDFERQKLRDIVETAHAEGRRVRFWATPDHPSPAREAVWRELLLAGVDLINTDDLDGLQRYLLEHYSVQSEGM